MDYEFLRGYGYTVTSASPSLLSRKTNTSFCNYRTATLPDDWRTLARRGRFILPDIESSAGTSEFDKCNAGNSKGDMRGGSILRSKFIITRNDDMYFYVGDVDLIIYRRPDCRISVTTNDIPSTL